jgi:hypothetical protein
METIDRTRPALGSPDEGAPLVEPDGGVVGEPAAPIVKLAEYDRHLSSIGAEVAALQEELVRLRADADQRAHLLAEREVVIAELSGLLPTLDEERVRARQQAEDASAALADADARLAAQTARVAQLERELEEVGTALGRRVRRLAELEGELAEARAAVEEEDGHAEEASTFAEEPRSAGHLRFVLSAEGYEVSEWDGTPPRPGDLVEIDGERLSVAKVSRSPLPNDQRPCAYLLPEPGQSPLS